jgi:hypothetical protein
VCDAPKILKVLHQATSPQLQTTRQPNASELRGVEISLNENIIVYTKNKRLGRENDTLICKSKHGSGVQSRHTESIRHKTDKTAGSRQRTTDSRQQLTDNKKQTSEDRGVRKWEL